MLIGDLLPLGNNMKISNANGIADFDKVDKKSVSVISLKCNNIDVNVNGLEFSALPLFLSGDEIASEAQMLIPIITHRKTTRIVLKSTTFDLFV